jgi:hypothetical protein
MGDFWAQNKDLSALAVSLIALVVSIVTAGQNVKATRQIAQDAASHAEAMARIATYQRIHEMLVEPSAAAGRRRLFQTARDGRAPAGRGGLGRDQLLPRSVRHARGLRLSMTSR